MLRQHRWAVSLSTISRIIIHKTHSDHGEDQYAYNMTSVSLSFSCVHRNIGKIAALKKPSFPLPSFPQCQPGSFFKRCGVTVVWERMFVSDATCIMVLKQATQRTLFRWVTFGNGWSYFGKMFGPKKAFPFIIWFLNAFVKSAISWWREGVCLCLTHSGEASFQFQVIIFGHAC